MAFFDKLISGLHGIAIRLVWLSGTLLILSAFLVTVDVIVRKIFGVSMAGADEITGYVFGISIMFSLSYAILHRSNIRIDALYQYMPNWLRAVFDIVGTILLVGFIAFVAYRGYFLVADTYQYGSRSITPLRTPLAIPQTPWLIGMGFAVFTGVVLILAGLVGMLNRNWSYVNRLMGIPTVDEQVKDETEGT